MKEEPPVSLFRFGPFELDSASRELRRRGIRIKLHSQPFQILSMLVARPGEVLSREEICRELWPDGTFVDYEHGVNSAINRLRDALGDKASNPRFVETVARRGYRFAAAVEKVGSEAPKPEPAPQPESPILDRVLSTPEDLPSSSHGLVRTLFLLLQLMYLAFYIAALANLGEIGLFFSTIPFAAVVVTAALLIPVRTFLICAVLFRAPRFESKYRKLWPFLLALDALWSLAPFLLPRINYGLALACTTLLVYSPFAQRALILMGGRQADS